MRQYYIRDPIHGFIEFNEWEKTIINSPEFQRLRRIKQLSLSDMVYPGTNHTRFEHSLGVMHVATQMFDNIVQRNKEFLYHGLGYDESALKRQRLIIRFAGLLHDIGHAPFSHVGEDLMPVKPGQEDKQEKERYKHEDYSITIIKNRFKEYIEEYLDWDDWKVGGLIREGKAGILGGIILNRNHYRRVYETSEVPSIAELSEFETICSEFKNEIGFIDSAERSWYKKGNEDIPIVEVKNSKWRPLSEYSNIVKNLVPCKQKRIYVSYEERDRIELEIKKFREGLKGGS